MQHTDTDPDEVVAVLARLPRWIVESIEKEATTLSERAGGVHVSRNAALVVLLKRCLGDKRKKPAPRVQKGEESRTLRLYRFLHGEGRVTNLHAASVCGCSEASIRRWLRGETQLDAVKEQLLGALLEDVQHVMTVESAAKRGSAV